MLAAIVHGDEMKPWTRSPGFSAGATSRIICQAVGCFSMILSSVSKHAFDELTRLTREMGIVQDSEKELLHSSIARSLTWQAPLIRTQKSFRPVTG